MPFGKLFFKQRFLDQKTTLEVVFFLKQNPFFFLQDRGETWNSFRLKTKSLFKSFFYFWKNHCLPSVFSIDTRPMPLDTRQTCHECLLAVTLLFFCRVAGLALGKVFAVCPIKNTRQRNVCRLCIRRVLFAERNTRQSLCRVFFGLRRVTWAHGKLPDSGCEWWWCGHRAWYHEHDGGRLDWAQLGSLRLLFIFFKSINGGRHLKTSAFINRLTEAGKATASGALPASVNPKRPP